ncbi:hypothetical protein [Nitrosophilus alvini]|uniref:hypothetical protein n=1 Tax=Nitrosophilus alvini TaxID=2714855 RepID=UPI00190D0C20|nr:hypothetical protein [Nitrosophilus alvini]
MNISNEGLLAQLGYNVDEKSLRQLNDTIENTKKFDKIKKHLIALNDNLKHTSSYVALSNSFSYFKIKIDTDNETMINEAKEIINKWADKYNVKLKKVENKETFYIIGVEK